MKENFKFYEKIDGSLIKIYKYNGEWYVSIWGSVFVENFCVLDVMFKCLVL